MVDIAYAQAAPGAGGPGPIVTILPFILIFVIMYFMVIRPQQKKAKEHQDLLSKLKRNDEVMTSGGIYGKVDRFKGDGGDVGSGSERKNPRAPAADLSRYSPPRRHAKEGKE